MKQLGTSFFLITVILVSFGFVLSDNFHIRQDLQEIQTTVVEANDGLKSCQATLTSQEAELQSLQFQLAQQAERNLQLEAENTNLSFENDQLRAAQPNNNNPWVNVDPITGIVIVITQVLLMLTQKLHGGKLGFQLPVTDKKDNCQSVRLTKEELKIIIELRRKK